MSNSRPESYFETCTVNNEEFGILGCFDGHSMSASDISSAVNQGYKYFYDVLGGNYDEFYIVCSKKVLTNEEVNLVDAVISGI